MTERDEAVNTLLGMLHQFDVVDLVKAHYAQYGNSAPPLLLEMQIKKVQP